MKKGRLRFATIAFAASSREVVRHVGRRGEARPAVLLHGEAQIRPQEAVDRIEVLLGIDRRPRCRAAGTARARRGSPDTRRSRCAVGWTRRRLAEMPFAEAQRVIAVRSAGSRPSVISRGRHGLRPRSAGPRFPVRDDRCGGAALRTIQAIAGENATRRRREFEAEAGRDSGRSGSQLARASRSRCRYSHWRTWMPSRAIESMFGVGTAPSATPPPFEA